MPMCDSGEVCPPSVFVLRGMQLCCCLSAACKEVKGSTVEKGHT